MNEYIVQENSLTAIADAIREKTGNTELLKLEEMPEEISNIKTGETADTREIYQGTRPLEWIRMPDYDKLGDNTIYFLFDILPYGDNIFDIQTRHDGNAIIEYGSTKDGVFVADAEYGQDIYTGAGGAWTYFNKVFNYDEWGKYPLSNGRRQILIKITFAENSINRIGYNRPNMEVKEILCNCYCREDYYFRQGGATDKCHYHYMHIKPMPNEIKFPTYGTAKYVQKAEGFFDGLGDLNTNHVILNVLNKPFKNTMYWECFRNASSMEEFILDISELTQWNNPFRGTCKNMKRLLFIGGENLTSFPGDINLNPSSLNQDAVEEFFNTLPNITASGTVRTITLTNSPAATNGIAAGVLAIANDKGWSVVW